MINETKIETRMRFYSGTNEKDDGKDNFLKDNLSFSLNVPHNIFERVPINSLTLATRSKKILHYKEIRINGMDITFWRID